MITLQKNSEIKELPLRLQLRLLSSLIPTFLILLCYISSPFYLSCLLFHRQNLVKLQVRPCSSLLIIGLLYLTCLITSPSSRSTAHLHCLARSFFIMNGQSLSISVCLSLPISYVSLYMEVIQSYFRSRLYSLRRCVQHRLNAMSGQSIASTVCSFTSFITSFSLSSKASACTPLNS